ncbi:ABC transporter substrate-binding protein [Curvibacter sp. APW13]|uniref:ABC transporter substrate-binding protein n=1 Tax=Curvibacter sp. APW13 TaxID=3077236 RepID=UPI0028DD7812|nr:ABC transporter substrate-binding protein [Curvibacter sp. APW13]MDT8990588.1 ABC transporter substrate-binding protein [Curvibacter sp. APW13]
MFFRPAWAGLVLACFALPALPADLQKDRLSRIETTKTLRVCIWPDYYGISYRNPKSLQLIGIDIDNAQAVAKELGVQVQFVDSSFAKLVEDVTADRCDIAMFAVGITPARQEKLRFTQPHLVSDIYGITTKTNRRIQSWADIDRPGVVVAVAKGTLHEPVMKAKLRNAELLVVDTPAAREQEVQSGRADVFMTDYPFSRRMLDNSEWARLVSPTETYHLTPYGWAMAYGDDRFFARIDKALGDMKRDGRLLANARKHGLEAIVAK